jgi:uncharacterized protein
MISESGHNNLRSPLISILVTLLAVAVGFQVIGPILGMMIAYPFYPGTHIEFANAVKNPYDHAEFRTTLLIMQGFGTFFGMVVIPFFILRYQRRHLSDLFRAPLYTQTIFIVLLLVVVFMGVNSVFIEWNQNIKIPGINEWAEPMEEKLAKLLTFVTKFDSIGYLILAFIVIAIIPAFGEEIVFRGIIQNEFYRSTRNIHLSIWISAILFSAIHLQFFGFVPRMLLGALFGYLYFWSGNLWLSVLAHFVNNGVTVLALYLYQQKKINIDLEDPAAISWQGVAVSAVFSAFLLYAFKNFYNKVPKTDIPD